MYEETRCIRHFQFCQCMHSPLDQTCVCPAGSEAKVWTSFGCCSYINMSETLLQRTSQCLLFLFSHDLSLLLLGQESLFDDGSSDKTHVHFKNRKQWSRSRWVCIFILDIPNVFLVMHTTYHRPSSHIFLLRLGLLT